MSAADAETASARNVAAGLFVWISFAAALLQHLRFIFRYSYAVPFWDESGFIPYITGSQPITLGWLWSQANEHRIVLHRVIYVTIVRLFGLESRIFNSLSVVVLAITCALVIYAVAKRRVSLKYSDAFLALMLLHVGHSANTTWPIQIGFIIAACLPLIWAAAIISGRLSGSGSILVTGVAGLLMCFCGANGLPGALMLVLYLIWAGIRSRVDSRRDLVCAHGFAILISAFVVLYFFRYTKYVLPIRRRFSIEDSIQESIKALSTAFGPSAALFWPIGGVAVALLTVFTLVLLFRTIWREPEHRHLALCLLLVISAVCAVAAGIGYGRAILGRGAGFAPHYTTFITPLAIAIYLAYRVLDGSRFGEFMCMGLFAAACVLLLPNDSSNTPELEARHRDGQALERDVKAGMPIRKLANDYGPRWMFNAPIFARYMGMLAHARLGIYSRYAPPADGSDNLQLLSENTEAKGPGSGRLFPLREYKIEGNIGMIAHAGHRCTLPVSNDLQNVSVGFGLLPDQPTAGAVFRVSVRTSTGERVLWSDAIRREQGFGRVQHATFEVSPSALPGSILVFETLPLTAGGEYGAWAFWTDVRIN